MAHDVGTNDIKIDGHPPEHDNQISNQPGHADGMTGDSGMIIGIINDQTPSWGSDGRTPTGYAASSRPDSGTPIKPGTDGQTF